MQAKIDTSKPHAARMYDYLLGGKDHFAVDRETAEAAIVAIPTGRTAARENRAFLGRAVRYLVHEVAQEAAPESRVVYVDNDPIVLSHARALLTSTPQGRSAYIEADLCEPEKILAGPAIADTLDLTKPLALMLVGILHFVPDEANPAQAVTTLLDALPRGSYLAASHGAPEFNPEGAAAWTRTYRAGGVPFQLRTADEFTELAFRGLEFVDPGLVVVSDWHPDGPDPRPLPEEVGIVGGVAKKP